MVVSLYRPWGQRTTILQKNTYNFNSGWGGGGHQCCGGGGGNGGMWAAFGITAGLSLLANIFGGRNRGAQMNTTNQFGFYGQQQYSPYGQMPSYDFGAMNRYTNPQQLTDNNAKHKENLDKAAEKAGFTVYDNGNGKYTLDLGDGKPITDDYTKILNLILAKSAKPSAAATAQANELAATRAAAGIDSGGTVDTTDTTETTETTNVQSSSTTTETTIGAYSNNRMSIPGGWERIATSERNTKQAVPFSNAGTYFIDGKSDVLNRNDIENSKSAQDVANYLMYNEMNMPSPMIVDKNLVAEIIKYNPSVFNKDGSVKENADWNKLDLPNKEYLEEKGYLNKTSKKEAPAQTDSNPKQDKKEYNATTQHHSDNFTAYVQYDKPVTAAGGTGYVIVNGKKYSSPTGLGLNAARNKNSIEEWLLKHLRKDGYTGNITFQRVE